MTTASRREGEHDDSAGHDRQAKVDERQRNRRADPEQRTDARAWRPPGTTGPACSTPTSSVIQASSAPLLNVHVKPMKAAATSTSQTPFAKPGRDEPEPEPDYSER